MALRLHAVHFSKPLVRKLRKPQALTPHELDAYLSDGPGWPATCRTPAEASQARLVGGRIAYKVGDKHGDIPVMLARVRRLVDPGSDRPLVGLTLDSATEEHCEWLLEAEALDHDAAEAVVRAALWQLGEQGAVVDDDDSLRIHPSRVGRGAFANVVLVSARDGRMGEETLALKMYKDNGKTSDEDIAREVRTLVAAQGHPNVLQFYGLHTSGVKGAHGPSPFAYSGLLTEYCQGGDLAAQLEEHPANFTEARVRDIMWEVLSGLQYIHSRLIAHRDVKLANLLVRHDGGVVLADFGLACFTNDEAEMLRRCGTPGYAAPEIILNKGCNWKSDVFSAGIVLYVLVGHRMPIESTDVEKVLSRTARTPVGFERNEFREVSHACKNYILLLTSKSVFRRPSAEAARSLLWMAPPSMKNTRTDKSDVPSEAGRQISLVTTVDTEDPVRVGGTTSSMTSPTQRSPAGRGRSADAVAFGRMQRIASMYTEGEDFAGVDNDFETRPPDVGVVGARLPRRGFLARGRRMLGFWARRWSPSRATQPVVRFSARVVPV